jgi:ribulose-phosphate 3-epimerase
MPSHLIEIAPSILAADFSRLGDEIAAVVRGGASVLHVDVMDGHFVPNISIGVPVVASLRKATRLPLDVHLMIEAPERYVEMFASAGATRILVHQEATPHLDRALSAIRDQGAEAGAVINPATPVAMLEEILDRVDTVLVMAVNPGFGGQRFIPGAYAKIRELRERRQRHNFTYRIEVDGGVGPGNIGELVAAGAETLVAGTSVFGEADPRAAVRHLLALAMQSSDQGMARRGLGG